MKVGNIKFAWRPYIEQQIATIKEELKENMEMVGTNTNNNQGSRQPYPHKSVITIHPLTWDLEFRKDRLKMLKELHELTSLVKQIKQTSNTTRIIFWTGMPAANRTPYVRTSTGDEIGAFSKLACDWMKEAGVETLDMFQMLYSVNDKDGLICPHHLICVIPPQLFVSGEFGKIAAELLFYKICAA